MRSLAFGTETVESIRISAFEFTVFPLLVHRAYSNAFSNLMPSLILGVLIQTL